MLEAWVLDGRGEVEGEQSTGKSELGSMTGGEDGGEDMVGGGMNEW